ncbi:MAG: LLM class flavin-dependent oxidoreductase [Deltaproteobacteria bacterium]|nr:LLM class flavin-dependent oxidoreductase [Deltaproteobacteria bacterium]
MEFGVQIGNAEFPQLRDMAQMAEDLGFDWVTVPDHIVYEGPEKQADLSHLSYDPYVRAAAILQATRRVRVGHLVLCNLFRHPAITAQSLMTLDRMSDGRVFCGIGSGWTESEFRMTGIPYPDITTRLRMLDESLTVMRSLWTQERTNFSGEFYRFTDAVLHPKPVQQPHMPILLGGGGKGLLRVAAKHADYLNVISDAGKPGYISVAEISRLTDAAFAAKVKFVREETARHGRPARAVKISNVSFTTMITDSPEATKGMSEAMAGFLGVPADLVPRSPMALVGTPDECIAELRRRAEQWEIEQVIFSMITPPLLERIGREILPAFR